MIIDPYRYNSFRPANLFSGGFSGGYYEFTDSATLWSDTARTTPATSGGNVKGVTDKSGNGNHLQNSSGSPGTTRNSSGLGVDFSGTNSVLLLTTGGVAVGGTTGHELIVVARGTGSTGTFLDADYNVSTRVTQGLRISGATIAGVTFGTAAGANSLTAFTAAASFATSTDYVFTNGRTPSAMAPVLINGVASGTAAQATANVASVASGGNWAIGAGYLGTTTANNNPLTGRIAAILFIGRPLTAPERAQAQTYMGALIGLVV